MVVTLIVGILAAIAVPRYSKTIEVAKTDEAQTLLQTVYSANRMYVLNNCPTMADCYRTGALSVAHALVSGDYVLNFNFPEKPFEFYTANDANAGTYAACARRRTAGSQGTSSTPYNGWQYRININGVLCGIGTNVPLPSGAAACGGGASCP